MNPVCPITAPPIDIARALMDHMERPIDELIAQEDAANLPVSTGYTIDRATGIYTFPVSLDNLLGPPAAWYCLGEGASLWWTILKQPVTWALYVLGFLVLCIAVIGCLSALCVCVVVLALLSPFFPGGVR